MSALTEARATLQGDTSNRVVITPTSIMSVTSEDTASECRSLTRGSWHKMAALTMLAARAVQQTQEPALCLPLQLSTTICTRRVIQSILPPIASSTMVFGRTEHNEYKTDSEFAALMSNVARKMNLKTRSIMGQDIVPNFVGHRGGDGIMYVVVQAITSWALVC